MNKTLRIEIYRAFINKKFLLTILMESVIVLAFIFISEVPIITKTIPFKFNQLETSNVKFMPGAFYTWLGVMNSSIHAIIKAILPLLIAIPYGDSLFLDEKSHYVYHIDTRCKRNKFYLAKLISMFLSGGTVAIFPYMLSFLINIALLPMETTIPSTGVSMINMTCFSSLYYSKPILYVVVYLIFTFIGFGILNCLCFTASYLFNNKFIVTLFPFTVDYFMYMMGHFLGGRNTTPWVYLNLNNAWKTDIPAAVIQYTIFLLIIFITYFYKCKRKVDVL